MAEPNTPGKLNPLEKLKEFNYDFNEKGQLRHRETHKPFVFKQHNIGTQLNHQWYKALGAILAEYVYALLEEECQLKRVCVPVDASADEPKSFCYMSEGALTNPSDLIVLLQDRGVMRAGEWSQQLILRDCLNSGSQIPFIKKAQSEQYNVVVLNPNDNFSVTIRGENDRNPGEAKDAACVSDPTDRSVPLGEAIRQIPKRGVESVEQHTIYTWDHFISKSAAKNVAFVAHGYGGLAFVNLLNERSQEVRRKVRAVAFVNSAHDVWHQNVPKCGQAWIRKTCCNWVVSPAPLDEPVTSMRMNCPQVSAGTEHHEAAPSICCHSVFKYLRKAFEGTKAERFAPAPIVTRSSSKLLSARKEKK